AQPEVPGLRHIGGPALGRGGEVRDAEDPFVELGAGHVEARPLPEPVLDAVAVHDQLVGGRQRPGPALLKTEDPAGAAARHEPDRRFGDLLQGRFEPGFGQQIPGHGGHLPREVTPVHGSPPARCRNRHCHRGTPSGDAGRDRAAAPRSAPRIPPRGPLSVAAVTLRSWTSWSSCADGSTAPTTTTRGRATGGSTRSWRADCCWASPPGADRSWRPGSACAPGEAATAPADGRCTCAGNRTAASSTGAATCPERRALSDGDRGRGGDAARAQPGPERRARRA